MTTARWKMTLEYVSDDGEGEPQTTIISQTGDWNSERDEPAPECIALTAGAILRMLIYSGTATGEVRSQAIIDSFTDAVCDR